MPTFPGLAPSEKQRGSRGSGAVHAVSRSRTEVSMKALMGKLLLKYRGNRYHFIPIFQYPFFLFRLLQNVFYINFTNFFNRDYSFFDAKLLPRESSVNRAFAEISYGTAARIGAAKSCGAMPSKRTIAPRTATVARGSRADGSTCRATGTADSSTKIVFNTIR